MTSSYMPLIGTAGSLNKVMWKLSSAHMIVLVVKNEPADDDGAIDEVENAQQTAGSYGKMSPFPVSQITKEKNQHYKSKL